MRKKQDNKQNRQTGNEKLRVKDKISYGSAALADAGVYTFSGTFLLFFLTTVAGMEPALAGTIAALGAVVDMIASPVVGFMSDHFVSKNGKRIPFLRAAAVPMGVACCLLFSDFGLRGTPQAAYYVLAVMMFWIAYSVFFNPYMALGAEITEDYDERTSLRSFAYIFNTLGMFTGMVLPNSLVAVFVALGVSRTGAWTLTAGAVGVLAMVSILVTGFFSPKGIVTNSEGNVPKAGLKDMLQDYKELLRLKPLWILMGSCAAFLIANSIGNSTRMYYFTYNLHCSPAQITLILAFIPISGMLLTPVVRTLGVITDKKIAYITSLCVSGTALLVLRLVVGIHGTFGVMTGIVFTFLYSISNTAYWQLMPSMIYDICTLDELENGKRREGSLSAIECFAEAVFAALGQLMLGLILGHAGFHGSAVVQSATALTAIENTLLILVAIFIFGAAAVACLYPISKDVFHDMIRKLTLQREGEKHDVEG